MAGKRFSNIKRAVDTIGKGRIWLLAVIVAGYMIVYFTAHNSPIYIPTVAYPDEIDDVVIVLDAGHGGADGGCVSVNGVPEKGINLEILLRVKALCESAGYQVVTTRESDVSIHDKGVEGLRAQKESDMENRLEIMNLYENAVVVSIHQNQFTDPKYSDAQMFYTATNPDSQRLAQIMQEKFVSNLQPENKREIKLSGKELYLIYFTKAPSVMVECGFLSNPEEATKLESEQYQSEVAFTIFSGIVEFLEENKGE